MSVPGLRLSFNLALADIGFSTEVMGEGGGKGEGNIEGRRDRGRRGREEEKET